MEHLIRQLGRLAVAAAVCLLTISTSLSDDIDVYVAPIDSAVPGDTYVVFTLDVRPNVMSETYTCDSECIALFEEVEMTDRLNDGSIKLFDMLVAALTKVLNELGNDSIKVALMISHEDSKNCVGPQSSINSCSNGGYVLSAFRSTGDETERNKFLERLDALPLKDEYDFKGQWNGHTYQIKELFFEMYRYITKGDVFNGENGGDDFNGESELIDDLSTDTDAMHPSEKRYVNTLDSNDHCSSIFSINVSFANSQQDNDSNEFIAEPPPAGFGFQPSNSTEGEQEVIEYLANTDLYEGLTGTQNITSYFVTLPGGRQKQANAWARAGGTGSAILLGDNPNELVDRIEGLFNEILGVSTTFVAASVPANVFNRAETLDEVFLAIFEPDENKRPFWVGNVKKLTTRTIDEVVSCEDLNNDGDTLDEGECQTEERKILVDVLEAEEPEPTSAINPLDGRIRAGARTYWTRAGTNNEYLPPPPPPEPDAPEQQDEYTEGTDGRKVDRGGAGQVKPGYLGIGTPGEPGVESGSDDTTISGPRMILTEAYDDSNTSIVGLMNLDADSGRSTAVNLLTDNRTYPGKSITYGANLYDTVTSDCSTCASSYADADDNTKTLAEDRVNNLIKFARGYAFNDIDTPKSDDTSTDTVDESIRSWWQADPLHSRPLALNYGARGNYTVEDPDIRVIVAGNDGIVQMIRDGRRESSSEVSPEDGVEAWSFLPREFVPLQKRLLLGSTGEYLPGVPVGESDGEPNPPRTPLHPYAMDGAPTALVIDNNLDGTISTADGDQAYLFVGQRRGGKRYYALDISDPDDPKYLWSIGKDDDGDDFVEMAQSWSLLRAGIMRVKAEDSDDVFRRPVLVFSGGYNGDDGGDGAGDLGKDERYEPGPDGEYGTDDDVPIVGTNDTEGNALFIVNALTGELIWKAVGPPTAPETGDDPSTETVFEIAELVDSVAASPTIVDSNGDGMIDRVYFPDTGGNVWRMDAGNPNRAEWTVHKLFEGGRHDPDASGKADDRRFFNAPDVVLAEDDNGAFDAVILASGDRPHPLGTDVENWIYMIKDRNTTSGIVDTTNRPLRPRHLADLTDNCLQDGNIDNCDDTQQANLFNGWKVKLEQCEAGGTGTSCGEKSLASPLTIEGTIFLTSYLPVLEDPDDTSPETCGPKEGGGLFYALDLQTAGGVLDFDPTNDSDGTTTPDRFDRLASPGIPPEPVAISPEEVLRPDLEIQKTEGRKSAKTFWYERQFD